MRAGRARRRSRAPARGARSRPSTCSAGCDAGAEHLLRHGGHRAAAGCTVDARRARRLPRRVRRARRGGARRRRTSCRVERVDAVVAGDELGLALAEELGRLAPFGIGNPRAVAAGPRRAADRSAPDGGGQARALHRAGRRRPRRARSRSARRRCPTAREDGVDATFGLELNEWQRGGRAAAGAAPRLRAATAAPVPIGGRARRLPRPPCWPRPPRRWRLGRRPAPARPADAPGRLARDRRGGGSPASSPALVARRASRCSSSAPTTRGARRQLARPARRLRADLVARARARPRPRRRATAHVVALDPPPHAGRCRRSCEAGRPADGPSGLGRARATASPQRCPRARSTPLRPAARRASTGRCATRQSARARARGAGARRPRPARARRAAAARPGRGSAWRALDRDGVSQRQLVPAGRARVDLERSPAYARLRRASGRGASDG